MVLLPAAARRRLTRKTARAISRMAPTPPPMAPPVCQEEVEGRQCTVMWKATRKGACCWAAPQQQVHGTHRQAEDTHPEWRPGCSSCRWWERVWHRRPQPAERERPLPAGRWWELLLVQLRGWAPSQPPVDSPGREASEGPSSVCACSSGQSTACQLAQSLAASLLYPAGRQPARTSADSGV